MITMIVIVIICVYFGAQIFAHGFMACFQNFWVVDAAIMWYLSLPFIEDRFLPEITDVQKFLVFLGVAAFTWAVFKFFAIGAFGIMIFSTFMIGREFYHDYGLSWGFWVPLVIVIFLQGVAFMNLRGELEEDKKAFRDEMKDLL